MGDPHKTSQNPIGTKQSGNCWGNRIGIQTKDWFKPAQERFKEGCEVGGQAIQSAAGTGRMGNSSKCCT